MVLSKQEIKHIADLARLELSEEELEKYGNQLSGVLEYIEMLREVDTSKVEPTAQVTGLENVFRKDEVVDWGSAGIDAALGEAPLTEGRYIKVKKVFE